ncbi:MAG TPA: hypothetical protein VN043_13085 [Rhodanobacter sp.]|nr:hypothetical protein [Rhodanobacter sp.]
MRMNDVLLTPWRSTLPSVRRLVLPIFGSCCMAAIMVGALMHGSQASSMAVTLYCFGVGYLWAFLMSGMLLLSIDARQLRLPDIRHVVIRSLLLYGVFTVAVPMLAGTVWGEHAVVDGLLAALAAVAALTFVLLPRYLALLFCFLPALHGVVRDQLHVPASTDPRFLVWGGAALLALVLISMLRWRQLLHAQPGSVRGLGGAIVMQMRDNRGMSGWNPMTGYAGVLLGWDGANEHNPGAQLRQRPDWMQPRVSLRRVGPGSLRRTFQVALGGWYLPQTLAGHVRQMAPVLLPLVLFVPVMAISKAGDAHDGGWGKAWQAIDIGIIGWIGLFGGGVLALATVLALSRRWRKTGAELSLLSLLPGLGDVRAVRRALVHAALGKPLLAQAALLLLVLGAGLHLHMSGIGLLLIALAQFGCAAVMVAFGLGTLGGAELPPWASALLLSVTFALVCGSTFMPLLMAGRHHWHPGLGPLVAMAVSWATLAIVLLWLGRRGWRGLLQRPHPFLAN